MRHPTGGVKPVMAARCEIERQPSAKTRDMAPGKNKNRAGSCEGIDGQQSKKRKNYTGEKKTAHSGGSIEFCGNGAACGADGGGNGEEPTEPTPGTITG